jgi:hypothetical protein
LALMIATGVNVVFAVIEAVYASMHQPGEARNP